MISQPVDFAARPTIQPARVINSADLFGKGRTLTIAHNDEAYRLQITAAGKLILTK